MFNNIARELLHGKRELFEGLSEHEQALVLKWLSDALVEGQADNAVTSVLWEIDYERRPVDITTFLTHPDYLGRSCANLSPQWMEDLQNVFAPASQVAEWVLTGAIGTGKTTIAMAALLYITYLLSCLRNPASYYGLLPNSMLVIGLYSITKKQVSDTGYFKLKSFVDTSPYFKHIFPRSPKIDSKILFLKKNMQIISGSTELHAIGLDLYGFALDEVNFMRSKADAEAGKMAGQAYDLYNATHTRILSRFVRPGGRIPGMMFLMSSRNAQTSFLEEHLKKITGLKNVTNLHGQVGKHTYVSDYSLWDVKPKTKFIKSKFRVEIGDRIARSRILKDEEQPRVGARVVEVPGDFRRPFDEDVDQALRDIAGVATFNVSPLIRDRQSVLDAVRYDLKHPFVADTVSIDEEDTTLLEEHFVLSTLCTVRNGRWVPKINPDCPRFIHVDTSLTGDCTGIAMSHASGTKRIRVSNSDGTTSLDAKPFVVVDLMLRIKPPAASEIPLWKIRSFIYYLRGIFPIAGVSFDGFQSRDSAQLVRKEGVDGVIQSLDETDGPYLRLRSALFDRRVVMYRYDPFIDEILDLERDIKSNKVDHPQRSSKGGRGSKDVADAVCGSVYWCLTDKRAEEGAVAAMARVEEVDPARSIDVPDHPSAPNNPSGEVPGDARKVKVNGAAFQWNKLRDNVRTGSRGGV